MRSSPRVALAEYPAKRIALIKPSALGDIVQSLPVLTALRQRYPTAHITWVVNRAYEPLLRGHPDLDETLPFDRGGHRRWDRALRQFVGFLRAIRRRKFDLVIDLQGLLRSGLMTFASGAARRVGLSTAREGATWFYTDIVPVADFQALHAVDRYWLVAKALGVGAMPKQFHVPIAEAEAVAAETVWAACPLPWMALAVGSRWRTKRWPPEHFAELVGRVQQKYGGTALFVGSAEDRRLSQEVGARLPGKWLDLTGQTTLPRLAALLACADVMIANDTGPLHLAVALGRPIVAPYTCTRVGLNGPFGQENNAVATRVYCAGSYLKRCARLDCMKELTPNRLWPILEGIVLSCEGNRRSA